MKEGEIYIFWRHGGKKIRKQKYERKNMFKILPSEINLYFLECKLSF